MFKHRLLYCLYVMYALIHEARQLLQAGEAVEFERIELFHIIFCQRDARLHLAFRLDFHLTQLLAQAYNAGSQLQQPFLEDTHFGFHARTNHADFTGFVDQFVHHVGTHAQHVAKRGARLRSPIGSALDTCRLIRRTSGWGCNWGWYLPDFGHRLAAAQFSEQSRDSIKIALQRVPRSGFITLMRSRDTVFHFMGDFTDAHRTHHARTAFHGMQPVSYTHLTLPTILRV